MNESEAQNTNESQDVFATPPRTDWTPHLEFYHPNAKGTGSALRVSIAPAEGDRDGAVFFTLATQSSVFVPAQNGAPAKFASFDWGNKLTVKFTFSEVTEIILLLAGSLPAVGQNAKGDGFFHSSSSASTIVGFRRGEDPARPGFLLDVTRTPKTNRDERKRVGLILGTIEAVGLRIALEQSMSLLAFGIPRARKQRTATSSGSEMPVLAVPALGTPFPPPPAAVGA